MIDPASVSIAPEEHDNFDNVEFIGNALKDPLNVLRLKLKDLSELDPSAIRRIIVVTDYASEDGERDLGVMFSEAEHESSVDAEDSVIATLSRLISSMTS